MSAGAEVTRLADDTAVAPLLARFGLELKLIPAQHEIPASYWGEAEAGLRGHQLFARSDTPLHSILHEACHYICMSAERRARLHTDAGADDNEENAVCYLSILLADQLPRLGRATMLHDMDCWGYSFRLGSARAWFDNDAADALASLRQWGLVDENGLPTYRVRS